LTAPVLLTLIAASALVAFLCWDRATRPVVRAGDGRHVRYTVTRGLQRRRTRRLYDETLAQIGLDGRLFQVPESDGHVTMDDIETWLQPTLESDGKYPWNDGRRWIRVREHLLHLDGGTGEPTRLDAVAFEFVSRADRDAFIGRIPEGGPRRRTYERMPSLSEQAMYN